MKTCLVMYGHFPLVFHSFMMYVRRNDFEILSCIFLRLFPVCNFYRHFYIDIPVELFTFSCMRDFVFSVFITFFHSSWGGGGGSDFMFVHKNFFYFLYCWFVGFK